LPSGELIFMMRKKSCSAGDSCAETAAANMSIISKAVKGLVALRFISEKYSVNNF
jgi:hypothetical protein